MSAPSRPVRALDLLTSEWTKFRSVRSTYWSLLVAVVTPVAVSAVVAVAFTSARNQGPPPDPLLPEVISLEYALIAVAVMGVLAFSAEYSTGLIRVTFTAAPRRRAVLAAKAVVLGAVTLAAGELVAFVSFWLVQAVLAGHRQGVSLGRPGVAGAVLPAPWNGRLGRFTLLDAARQVSALHPAADLLSPGWSLLVLLAWPAAALAAAAVLITRRDA